MSSTGSPSKLRQPRLRASCDGCFLAKVKCSKERPICKRCLTCGTDCKYSPSSRAGKPRADGTRKARANLSIDSVNESSFPADLMKSINQQDGLHLSILPSGYRDGSSFEFSPTWSSPFGSPQEQMHWFSSTSNTTASSVGDQSPDGMEHAGQYGHTFFEPAVAWNNVNGSDVSAGYGPKTSYMHSRSRSTPDLQIPSAGIAPWFKGSQEFNMTSEFPTYNNPAPSTNAPGKTPNKAPVSAPPSAFSDGRRNSISGNCTCFTTCLQALQALHNHSSPTQSAPAFDVVLNINRKAVQGCAMMLNCSRCAAVSSGTELGSGSSTAPMLLATVIDKVMGLYRAASHNHFVAQASAESQSPRSPLGLGAYSTAQAEGKWLEREMMWRELHKLEELFHRFQELGQGANGSRDFGVHSALSIHLGQSLEFTIGVLKLEEASFCSVAS